MKNCLVYQRQLTGFFLIAAIPEQNVAVDQGKPFFLPFFSLSESL